MVTAAKSLWLFGEFLVNNRVISKQDLVDVLHEQIVGNAAEKNINTDPETRIPIGEIMIQMKLLTEGQRDEWLVKYEVEKAKEAAEKK